jgi:hypothetical protein
MRVVLVLLASLVVGCQSGASAGAGCNLSSDCSGSLVCAGGACRSQCREARDCESGGTCSAFGMLGSGAGVCVPPMSPVPCALNSDCPGVAVCRSGRCVPECATDRDCSMGRCDQGACSTPLVVGGIDAGIGDASHTDAGCTTTCGARCVDLSSDAEHCGACGNACATGARCVASACVACMGATCGDECVDALPFTLTPGTFAALDLPAAATPSSTASCDPARPDTYFATMLDRRSLIGGYANGGVIGLLASCGDAAAQCTMCGVIGIAGPGAALMVADGTTGVMDAADIEALAIDDLHATATTLTRGTPNTIDGTLAPTTATTCTGAGGGDAVYWSCNAGATVTARVCPTSGTPLAIELRDSLGATACGAPDPSCPGGAVVNARIAGQIGVAVVRGIAAGATGGYTLTLSAP